VAQSTVQLQALPACWQPADCIVGVAACATLIAASIDAAASLARAAAAAHDPS
jgi:hypothetical protein